MHVTTVFIWFVLYSILGWVYETIYCSIRYQRWDNRGMLIGPYCPIYGVGAVLDVLLCGGLPNYKVVFFVCMIGSAIIEYTTSFATERLFHAVWWDYSGIPFNLNGRICLPCTLGFGVAGIVVLYGIHPYIALVTDRISPAWQEPVALLLMAVFAADCALTADSLVAVKIKLDAALKVIDTQIAEKYSTFLENTKQNLSGEWSTLKEKISLDELKKTFQTMNWSQIRVMRSSVAFRRGEYSVGRHKLKQILSFLKKTEDADTEK